MNARVCGLDLSLTNTGVASSHGWVERIRTQPGGANLARLRFIRDRALDLTKDADLVVVESLAISRQTGQHLTRAGLWHLVIDAIDAAGLPWAEITPSALKRYATGRGNATKDEVLLAAERRYPGWEVTGNDQADALILAAMGADHLGEPLAVMPGTHRTALRKITWPDVPVRHTPPREEAENA